MVDWQRGDALTRRQVMRGLAKSALGVTSFAALPGMSSAILAGTGLASTGLAAADPLVRSPSFSFGRPRAKRIIFLYMAGGMSHLDTFDPKPGREVAGGLGAQATAVDGLQVSELLPRTAAVAPHLSVIRSVTSTQGAHEQGRYFLHTSYQKRGTVQHPSLGTWLVKQQGRHHPTLPPSVVIGGGNDHPGSGFMGAAYAPLPIGAAEEGLSHIHLPDGVSQQQFQDRMALSQAMNERFRHRVRGDETAVSNYQLIYDEAVRLMASRDLAAFDLSQESAAIRAAYGDHRFGTGCLLARRLCEHGVRSVEVTLGGWDMHNEVMDGLRETVPVLDQAFSALITDLHQRGMLDETLVVLASEFGRTPVINRNAGRDHHPLAFSVVMAGGGIRGGNVYGRTDENGHGVAQDPVTIPDLNATIAYACGLDPRSVLYADSGRPFSVADEGKALTGVF